MEKIASLFLFCFSIIMFIIARGMSYTSPGYGLGNGFLPFWVCLLLIILSLLWIIKVFFTKSIMKKQVSSFDKPGLVRVLLLLGSLLILPLLINKIGYLETLIIFSIFIVFGIEKEKSTKAVKSLSIFIVSILIIYWVFGSFFNAMFPVGILDF